MGDKAKRPNSRSLNKAESGVEVGRMYKYRLHNGDGKHHRHRVLWTERLESVVWDQFEVLHSNGGGAMKKYSIVQERSWIGGKEKTLFILSFILSLLGNTGAIVIWVAQRLWFGCCFVLFWEGNGKRSRNSSHNHESAFYTLINRQGPCPAADRITVITEDKPRPLCETLLFRVRDELLEHKDAWPEHGDIRMKKTQCRLFFRRTGWSVHHRSWLSKCFVNDFSKALETWPLFSSRTTFSPRSSTLIVKAVFFTH